MPKITISTNTVDLVGRLSGHQHDFLLVHAGGESKKVWYSVQERLSRAGLGSAAFDQRGHGESSGSRAEDIQTFANDLVAMIAACEKPRIIVGASLGGLAAILALQDAETRQGLCGLVLVDVVPAPDPIRVRQFLASTAPHLADTFLVDNILTKGQELSAALEKIDIPLLLVRAGQSGPMSNEEVYNLRRLRPGLMVEHVDTAGHLIARDEPRKLADILLRFEQSAPVRNT